MLWKLVVVFAAGLVSVAHADPSGSRELNAEELFRRGRQLMKEGHFDEACVAFQNSQQVSPSPSTLANLADCRERSGKLAQAWHAFVELAEQTKQDPQLAQLNVTANKRANGLQSRISFLTISVPPVLRNAKGLEIQLDGEQIAPAFWNTDMAVDGGEHKVKASARCYMALARSVTIGAEHDHQTLMIDLQAIEACPDEQPAHPAAPAADAELSQAAQPEEPRTPKAYDRSRFFVGAVTGAAFFQRATPNSSGHEGAAAGVEVGWHQHLGSGPLFARASGTLRGVFDANTAMAEGQVDVRVGAAVAQQRLLLSLGVAAGVYTGNWGSDGYLLPLEGEVAYEITRWMEVGLVVAIDTSPDLALVLTALRFHL